MQAQALGDKKIDISPKCPKCSRILAWYACPPWMLQCSRCGSVVQRDESKEPVIIKKH